MLFFRHISVSSTYPCQLVGRSYFWISIAPEHFCATVVFDVNELFHQNRGCVCVSEFFQKYSTPMIYGGGGHQRQLLHRNVQRQWKFQKYQRKDGQTSVLTGVSARLGKVRLRLWAMIRRPFFRAASGVQRIIDYHFFPPYYRLIINFLILYRLILSTFLFSEYLA